MPLSGVQIRAARAMLRWSAKEAAEKAGISLPTIQRFEQQDGVPPSRSQTLLDLKRAFEEAGVEFIGTPEDGAGVRMRKK
jgi:transcriptional regulator with XRE-family HTH domain